MRCAGATLAGSHAAERRISLGSLLTGTSSSSSKLHGSPAGSEYSMGLPQMWQGSPIEATRARSLSLA